MLHHVLKPHHVLPEDERVHGISKTVADAGEAPNLAVIAELEPIFAPRSAQRTTTRDAGMSTIAMARTMAMVRQGHVSGPLRHPRWRPAERLTRR
jgi:hypothetical protein